MFMDSAYASDLVKGRSHDAQSIYVAPHHSSITGNFLSNPGYKLANKQIPQRDVRDVGDDQKSS